MSGAALKGTSNAEYTSTMGQGSAHDLAYLLSDVLPFRAGPSDLSFMDGAVVDLGALQTGPFPLPPAYERAKDNTVRAVADLRTAVKQVRHRPSPELDPCKHGHPLQPKAKPVELAPHLWYCHLVLPHAACGTLTV